MHLSLVDQQAPNAMGGQSQKRKGQAGSESKFKNRRPEDRVPVDCTCNVSKNDCLAVYDTNARLSCAKCKSKTSHRPHADTCPNSPNAGKTHSAVDREKSAARAKKIAGAKPKHPTLATREHVDALFRVLPVHDHARESVLAPALEPTPGPALASPPALEFSLEGARAPLP